MRDVPIEYLFSESVIRQFHKSVPELKHLTFMCTDSKKTKQNRLFIKLNKSDF